MNEYAQGYTEQGDDDVPIPRLVTVENGLRDNERHSTTAQLSVILN